MTLRDLLGANVTRLVYLTPAQCDARLVTGDRHMSEGEFAEGELDHIEASIGARVVRGPGQHGYNPMMARMMRSLNQRHTDV